LNDVPITGLLKIHDLPGNRTRAAAAPLRISGASVRIESSGLDLRVNDDEVALRPSAPGRAQRSVHRAMALGHGWTLVAV